MHAAEGSLQISLICHLKNRSKFNLVDVSLNLDRPLDLEALLASDSGLVVLQADCSSETLGSLPLGSRLVLRSRKDWRMATVSAKSSDKITLSVASPSGYTYRMYRPHDTPIVFDGPIPLLAEGGWRVGLARYDVRW
jgi:hypothetical protein